MIADSNNTVTTPEQEVDAEATNVTETVEETVEPVSDEAEAAEESTDSKAEVQIDYKAIAEQERERREAAERALAENAFKEREKRRKSTDESSNDTSEDDDRPLTRSEFMQLMREREQESTKSAQESKIKEIITQNTSSPEEAEAAFLMYQNRVVPTGDPVADAMFAIGGLNVQRTRALTDELKRSLASKDSRSTVPTSNQPDTTLRTEPRLNSSDAQAIKAAGLTWDGKKGLYTKKVGKKVMFFDPKRPQGQKSWIA